MIIFSQKIWQYFFVFFVIFHGNKAAATHAPEEIRNLTSNAQTGRKIYRQGMLPNGKKLQAIVVGDIPIEGDKFSCMNCHGRSGMGSVEGQYVVPPILGNILFSPSSSPPKRPAYNRKTLARVLRTGVNPAGKKLDPLMPKYPLSDTNVGSLSDYLKEMSRGQTIGIDEHSIRFATIITDEISAEKSKAVTDVYRAYVNKINSQTRLESKRPNRGDKPETQLPSLYRKWKFDIWRLKGPESGWPEQLANYYQKAPVFAVIGGITNGSWNPMGQFCERYRIPCLFPSTKFPEKKEGDYYTVYFSKGIELEAELIANDINSGSIKGVVQVFCDKLGSAAATKLRLKLKNKSLEKTIRFDCNKSFPQTLLIKMLDKIPTAATVFWLEKEKINQIKGMSFSNKIYVSSTILKQDYHGVLDSFHNVVYAAHPYLLPNKFDSALARFTVWARISHVKIPYPKIQAEAFFACFAVSDTLNHIRRYRLREYFLEMLDHSQALALYLPFYPNASMGPGQRFLTKGGYILPIEKGQPETKKARWISL